MVVEVNTASPSKYSRAIAFRKVVSVVGGLGCGVIADGLAAWARFLAQARSGYRLQEIVAFRREAHALRGV